MFLEGSQIQRFNIKIWDNLMVHDKQAVSSNSREGDGLGEKLDVVAAVLLLLHLCGSLKHSFFRL